MRVNFFPPGTDMICGGVKKDDSKVAPTAVSPGQEVDVTWEMGYWTGAALHQGWVTMSIYRGSDDKGPWEKLQTVSMVGFSTVETSPKGCKIKIPEDVKIGDPITLHFNWTGSVTNEVFHNCADLIASDTSPTYVAPPPKLPEPEASSEPIKTPDQTRLLYAQTKAAQDAPTTPSPTTPVTKGSPCDSKTEFYACSEDGKIAQCAGNKWAVKNCPPGLTCNPKLFVCDYQKSVDALKEEEKKKAKEAAAAAAGGEEGKCDCAKTVTVTKTVEVGCTPEAVVQRRRRDDVEL
ncbi:hypothetical protein HDU67_006881 [Dinochytrium kinnereticum]|nr:hypothetical protein HDU67_006881 [Dinochytrium kinnereticum]